MMTTAFKKKLTHILSIAFFLMDKSRSYRRFRIMFSGVMFVIIFAPLVVVTALSSFEYRELLLKEERNQLHWNAEGAQKTIEAFMTKLTSVVKFVSKDRSCDDLLDQYVVSKLLVNLKEEYPGFVDLGILDHNGIQQVYAGPFRLEGYDYSDQDWFDKVLAREVYISEVFMGFREIPHFVIAVSFKIPDKEEYWILRASIDYEKLQKYISTINTEASQDIFLVNRQGVLQTRSNLFGEVLEQYSFSSMPEKGKISITESKLDGVSYLKAYVDIKNAPWILGIVKEEYIHGKEWSSFQLRRRLIFLGCSLLAMVIIYQLVNFVTERLRESNEKRDLLMMEAEHSNKLASVGRLAAGVAHEINNPLAIIDQKAGLMTDLFGITGDFEHKEKLIKSIDGIHNAVERCKVITHRLLGFARRMDVVYERIDINALLQEVLGFLEQEALFNHIYFELVFDETLPMIFSDRGQLQQIFLNIINNGIDAIGHDGEMVLTTFLKDNTTIGVSICDSGPGMNPEIIKRIFDPFFSTKEAGKGTGLGLSITYGLVKKLGGHISVDSEVGQGTTFTVSLPVNFTQE
jgi:two-component system NtrC family sensor kinase